MRDIYCKVGREIYMDHNKHNIFRLKEKNLNTILENAYDIVNILDIN